MWSRVKVLGAIGLVLVGGLLIFPPEGWPQDCRPSLDWKDIYILPTNPNPADNIKISLKADRERVQPGQHIVISFQADRECYLTLMDVGTSGRIIRLWPNKYSGLDNHISANAVRSFPAAGDPFRFQIAGPDGTERIIAYATSERGKILTEEEFRNLQGTGFKEYPGGALDLAHQFDKNAAALAPSVTWGTAQVNICIGSGSPSSTTPVSSPEKHHILAFAGSYRDLKYTVKDAQDFVDTMKRKIGVPESNVRMVLGTDATYDGLVSGIQWLASRTQPDDTAVIYFNGHGSQIPDQPPLDEVDGRDEVFCFPRVSGERMDWREALRRKLIMTDDQFNKLIKKIPARKKIIVADTCHSGTINKAVAAGQDELTSKYFPLLDPDSGKELTSLSPKSSAPNYGNDNEALLASCLDSETSWESGKLKAGVFTYHLLRSIEEGAPDLEKAFEKAREATIRYVKAEVRPNQRPVSQTPSLTDPHGLVKLFKFSR